MLNNLNPYPQVRRLLEERIEEIFHKHSELLLKTHEDANFGINVQRMIPLTGAEEHLLIQTETYDFDPTESTFRDVLVVVDPEHGLQLTLQYYGGAQMTANTVQTNSGFRISVDDITWAVFVILRHLLQLDEKILRVVCEDYYTNLRIQERQQANRDATLNS
jgi:hypothetical protein